MIDSARARVRRAYDIASIAEPTHRTPAVAAAIVTFGLVVRGSESTYGFPNGSLNVDTSKPCSRANPHAMAPATEPRMATPKNGRPVDIWPIPGRRRPEPKACPE